MSQVLTWWLPIAALLAGRILLWLGMRGRRVDDHPVCRKCGRDLFGLGELPERCPECGSDLALVGVRIGNRCRREGLFYGGLLLGVPAVLWLAASAAIVLGGASLDQYKPVSLMAWEMDGPQPERASAELVRRLRNGELSPGQINALVDDFLVDQADDTKNWAPAKGDFVEHVQLAGGLSPDRWHSYCVRGIVPSLRYRSVTRVIRGVPYDVDGSTIRLGSEMAPLSGSGRGGGAGSPGIAFGILAVAASRESKQSTASDDSQRGNARVIGWARNRARHAVGSGSDGRVVLDETAALSVGLNVDLFLYLRPAAAQAAIPPATIPADAVHLGTVTLLPEDQPSVSVRSDPKLDAKVRQIVAIGSATGGPPGATASRSRHDDRVFFHYAISLGGELLPISMAFDVTVDDGRRRWDAGQVRFEGNRRIGSYHTSANLPAEFDTTTVDFILTSSVEAAEKTTTIYEIWGGELILEDVVVDWQ